MRLSIVSYLDPASTSTVRGIQQKLSELTESKACLELWRPHVTVGDGIEVNDEELSTLQERLNSLTATTTSFSVDLHGILKIDFRKGGEGEETTPYGLYLDVKPNEELLKLVADVSKVSEDLKKWYFMPSPYHPHCALAFKDLSREGFELGGAYLDKQNLTLAVTLNHIALVEMIPDATNEFVRFTFKK